MRGITMVLTGLALLGAVASASADELAHTEKPTGGCPVCRSSAVQTVSKAPDRESYWRCTTCGEIWNPARTARTFARHR